MKSSDIYFVTATKKSHDEFWGTSNLAKFLRKAKLADQTYVAYNNGIGLPDIYNHGILNSPSDYVVCVHDDVVIEDIFWAEKLEEGFEKFDILGLAGASNVTIKSPAMWHLMSERNSWSGAVNHEVPNQPGKVFATNFGVAPQRCLIMDGLFLAVNRPRLLDKGVMFNPKFKFHHYDIDFCLQANAAGLSMTTIPLHVTHASGGESAGSEAWKESEKLFLSIYG